MVLTMSHYRMMPDLQSLTIVVYIVFAYLTPQGSAISWVKFDVPQFAARGGDATLTCQFHLDGEQLYSVKWYKNDKEFYRYINNEWPAPQQAFHISGALIDLANSDQQRVRLRNVNLSSEGRYKCEVLTEAPHFKTLVKSGVMKVVELPRGLPQVTGSNYEYSPGDLVNVTCTSPLSIPPAILTWFINGQQAPQEYLQNYSNHLSEDGQEASRLGLQFHVHHWHFIDDRLLLTCKAQILRLYEHEVEHLVTLKSSLIPALLGGQSSGSSKPVISIIIVSIYMLFKIW
ncbi:unnamed protein product [Meganyctiphanes norvegica]|uniref:Ig-like domain-containing protein n=1 Tax=Meganyctiphanes norvegica TaxID=48144 RepID=A0AAV2QTM2_MEGNR